jgi:SAM-dependent methyltransferase
MDRVFEQTEAAFHNLRYLRMNARRQEHLASLPLPLTNRSVLEVGAGIGDHTHFFLDRGCSVTSTEVRPENVAGMRARYAHSQAPWPEERLRIVESDVYDLVTNGVGKHDVLYCYGLLYHLEEPLRALRICAELCDELLLLETRVGYGAATGLHDVDEDATLLTTSITGHASVPTRRWIFERLRELFPFVYLPITQPVHEQFRLDWRSATEPPGFHRAIFVASRSRLESALLIEDVPEIQYHALSNLGALAARAGTTVVKTIFGPIVSFENDLITAQLETFGAHTRNELAMLLRCVEPGDLILDIGAHVGTYTLQLAAVLDLDAAPFKMPRITVN